MSQETFQRNILNIKKKEGRNDVGNTVRDRVYQLMEYANLNCHHNIYTKEEIEECAIKLDIEGLHSKTIHVFAFSPHLFHIVKVSIIFSITLNFVLLSTSLYILVNISIRYNGAYQHIHFTYY